MSYVFDIKKYSFLLSYLFYPYISYHYLLFHINPNDLRKLHPHFHRQSIRAIANRTNESEKYYMLRIEHMKCINETFSEQCFTLFVKV